MEANKQRYRHDIINKRAPKRSATGLVPILVVILMPLLQCKQPYNSPYVSPKTGYLVIEGYISGNTTTSLRLSRTIKLSSDTTNPQEPGASVEVEGSDNSVYLLTDEGSGLYDTPGVLPLNTSVKYRLRIQTQSGGQYLSDYAQYKVTPPIDSVNWVQNDAGLTIYANAHDDAGNTRYYQWNYDEVWEYHSLLQSGYEYDPSDTTVIYRPPQDEIYRCWQGGSSTSILIGSTAKPARDEVYEYPPLRQFATNSVPLSVLYYILVRQYALTDSGYNYLSLMQKNTQSLGTIFDPQPSQLNGNIHCLDNPGEPVVGYISAGTIQQQQLYISNSQLSNWNYSYSCPQPDSVIHVQKTDLINNFVVAPYIPVSAVFGYGGIVGYHVRIPYCVDCRIMGGTTDKPSFWPN